MTHQRFIKGFLFLAALSFIASAATTYFYNLIVHGIGLVDWQNSFRFSILFGLVLAWIRDSKGKKA